MPCTTGWAIPWLLLILSTPHAPSKEVARKDSLEVVITPSVTAGIAPLSVFFDGLATDLLGGTPHEAEYVWTFADPHSRRTVERGFCTAHVFEQPGLYTASLHVLDRDGHAGEAFVQIHVEEFQGVTVYASSSQGNDANNGSSMTAAVASFDRAIQLMRSHIFATGPSTKVRVLFARGDAFSTATTAGIPSGTLPGPFVFGAYGNGNRPIITMAADDSLFYFHAGVSGVRLMDLDLRGIFSFATRSGGDHQQLVVISGGRQHLVLHCDISSAMIGIAVAGVPSISRSEVTIAESQVVETRNYSAYLGADRLAVIGNHFGAVTEMHVLRVWYSRRCVIVGNELVDPSIKSGFGYHALKLHSYAGTSPTDPSIPTQWVWIAENILRGSTWPCTIAPQNKVYDEHISNVVFERNLVLPDEYSSAMTNQMVLVVAQDVTVRQNALIGTNRSPDLTGVVVQQYPNAPVPARVRIEGNTFLQLCDQPGAVGLFAAVRGDAISAIEMKQNIAYAPYAKQAPTALLSLESGMPVYELREWDNLLYTPGSPVWAWMGLVPIGLLDWQLRDQGGMGVSEDPLFADARRLDLGLLPGSAAYQLGARLGAPPEVAERGRLFLERERSSAPRRSGSWRRAR